jgi:hypothetical protein
MAMIYGSSMVSSPAAKRPRILAALPVALLHGRVLAAAVILELRGAPRIPEPVGEGVYSVRVEVPEGEWLLWPEAPAAMWVGARHDALPGAVRERLTAPTDAGLSRLLDRLASAGVWVREASVLAGGEWGRPVRADAVLALLLKSPASALSGVFSDRDGEVARLEISAGGICWTDRPALAIQWLLAAYNLPVPR